MHKQYDRDNAEKGTRSSRSWAAESQGERYAVFEVEAPADGAYWFSVWVDGVVGQSLRLLIDGDASAPLTVTLNKEGWQNATFALAGGGASGKPLTGGKHILAFTGGMGTPPHVAEAKIGLSASESGFSSAEYDAFIAALRRDSKSGPKTPGALTKAAYESDPSFPYLNAIHQYHTYTWYANQWLTQGSSYTFQTSGPSPSNCDPVLYVFQYDNPSANTWMNDDGGGGRMAKVTFTAPVTGYYMVLLRAYGAATGTVAIKQNNTTIGTNCAVAGTLFYAGAYAQSGVMNYFTADALGDTRIWLMDTTGKVRAFNDDYSGTGSFAWGTLSRVRKQISQPIDYILLTQYSAPYGYADLYAKLGEISSSSRALFENLNADDAIQAAPSTAGLPQADQYNCYAWSGGLTEWIEPNHTSPWTGSSGNIYEAWDNYYANACAESYTGDPALCKRYSGAWNYYYQAGAGSPLDIDLYQNVGGVSHASVRKPGNGHPHGYDWEAKLGQLERVMHPRTGLEGGNYGSIIRRYYWNGTYAASKRAASQAVGGISFLESVALGLSVKPATLAFTAAEKARLQSLANSTEPAARAAFEEKYRAWQATWDDPLLAIQSHSEAYSRSQEYRNLLEQCRGMGKAAWPMIFSRFESGDRWAINLLRDLVLPGREARMHDLIGGWIANHQTSDGKFIPFSQRNTWVRFLQDVSAKDL